MTMLFTMPRWLAIVALLAVGVVGAALRLHDLDKSTIGHIEMYVPGLDLPVDLADPRPRHTLQDVLTGLLVEVEPHPPGYYLLMLGWTQLFGSDIIALRLPSVLFGVGSILLIFAVGALAEDRITGLVAAAMLALNGHHLLWSQVAKMYAMGCFLAVLATALLLLAARAGAFQRLFTLLYGATTLLGLGTVVFFWPLLATHMLWTLRANLVGRTITSELFQSQILVCILGSPLLALAILQAGRASYLDRNPLPELFHFLQFGFLFEPDPWAIPPSAIPLGLGIVLVLLALTLGAVGVGEMGKRFRAEISSGPGLPPIALLGAAVLSAAGILRLAQFGHGIHPERTPLVAGVVILPFLLAVVAWILEGFRGGRVGALAPLGKYLRHPPLGSLPLLLAVVPVGLLALVSPVVPVFESRTVLLFSPFLLVVLARGLSALLQRSPGAPVLVAATAVALVASTVYSQSVLRHPTDYKGLADQWLPYIESSDVILVQRHWATTPIFYYLRDDRFRFVGDNYGAELQRQAARRVWKLELMGLATPTMDEALDGYQVTRALEAMRIRSVLYTRV